MKNKLMIIVIVSLLLNGCDANTTNTSDIIAYQQCNINSFENDYSTTPKDGDNSYDVLDYVIYYGYCGMEN